MSNTFDWTDLAFASKKPVSELNATFIAAPRALSQTRIKQLIKDHLPKGNVIIGVAKEDFVDGFADNPAFLTLRADDIQPIIAKVNQASSKHKIFILHYFQRDLPHIIEKVQFRQMLLVRGSWHRSFHLQSAYYLAVQRGLKMVYVSPFADEAEAQAYAVSIDKVLAAEYFLPNGGRHDEAQMLALASIAAKRSLDYAFQIGVSIGRPDRGGYKHLLSTYNRVVPYQTYAMHFGNSREENFVPAHDLNHYDTIHAEMSAIVEAGKQGISLAGSSLFINVLPCPFCARTLAETDIQEFVYQQDHSDGYAVHLLEKAGKSVRRLA